jgi:hypothetical protein
MSSAESPIRQNLFRRVSTPLFLFLSLLLVPVGTFVSFALGIIVCIVAGIENADSQARIGLAALLIGFVGSVYLLIRARRSPASQRHQVQIATSAPPPLPIVPEARKARNKTEKPAETGGGYEAAAELDNEDVERADQIPLESDRIVDWLKVITTPVLITFNASLIFIALGATRQHGQQRGLSLCR